MSRRMKLLTGEGVTTHRETPRFWDGRGKTCAIPSEPVLDQSTEATMSDENKRVSRAFTEYFSTGSAALADEVLDPDVVFHGPAGIGELNGLDAVKGMVTGFREGFPDERSTVVDQVAEGDKVVTRWRARGTHDGEFNGLAATNREFAALADAPGLLLL